MSDTAQGPGWWQASDDRWYPPHPPDRGSSGAPQQTAGKATATLILAIASFVLCPVLPAIAALVVGAQAVREIRESGGRLGGEGLVKAGRILAVINLFLWVTIPILMAIAVPTFSGAHNRALDAGAKSRLRNAFTAEQVYRSDRGQWTADPAELQAIEPTITFAAGATPVAEDVVYMDVQDDVLILLARSHSGRCFYLAGNGSDGSIGYTEDEDCGAAEDQQFLNEWE